MLGKINNLMPPWTTTECTRQHPTMPSQSMGEWQAYLEFIDTYFRNREIKKPMIVEVGIGFGKQKRYYEEILGYEHIGVDISAARCPDIVGNSRNPATMVELMKILNGRDVHLVYLDAKHTYEVLKEDYKIYAPLAKNIIAIHDIVFEDCIRGFWDELMAKAAKSRIQDRTFITLTGYYTKRVDKEYSFGQGTGLILKEDMG